MQSFIFQAEDGIRDGTVTGVQTCALPIFTSQMSMPMRSPNSFNSLTNAMFTQRKMFSSSLAISAARVELTGTTRATTCEIGRASCREREWRVGDAVAMQIKKTT